MNNTFYAYGFDENGRQGTFTATVTYDISFFVMPTWMTNGSAATNTAIAVDNAFNIVQAWFEIEPEATESEVSDYLDIVMRQELAKFGGTILGVPPFHIPSPAPYKTSFFTTGNCK
ncbi:hypothetical protein MHTCC0001_35100 [Flavobacteriaceae bacterium MHTCC 0001]